MLFYETYRNSGLAILNRACCLYKEPTQLKWKKQDVGLIKGLIWKKTKIEGRRSLTNASCAALKSSITGLAGGKRAGARAQCVAIGSDVVVVCSEAGAM